MLDVRLDEEEDGSAGVSVPYQWKPIFLSYLVEELFHVCFGESVGFLIEKHDLRVVHPLVASNMSDENVGLTSFDSHLSP